MSRTITIEANGQSYIGKVGTIKRTRFGYQDHGILTADLLVEWPGGGVSVGGYSLDTPIRGDGNKVVGREGTAYGLDHLMWLMRTVGVETWEALTGQQVIVLFPGTQNGGTWGARPVGIAHISDEHEVFLPTQHALAWTDREAEKKEEG